MHYHVVSWSPVIRYLVVFVVQQTLFRVEHFLAFGQTDLVQVALIAHLNLTRARLLHVHQY